MSVSCVTVLEIAVTPTGTCVMDVVGRGSGGNRSTIAWAPSLSVLMFSLWENVLQDMSISVFACVL